MVLYDNNYKFIGISNDTLRFLGYEDVDEFCALHSDFANIFVQKEGFIYKYKNFSWIDYILYSGASQKQVLVTLKNGREVKAEINIKEIFLTNEISNSNKYYLVDLVSDFINAQSDNSTPVQVNKVDLHSMIGNDKKSMYEEPTSESAVAKPTAFEIPMMDDHTFFQDTEDTKEKSQERTDDAFKINLNFDNVEERFSKEAVEPEADEIALEKDFVNMHEVTSEEKRAESNVHEEGDHEEEKDFLLDFIQNKAEADQEDNGKESAVTSSSTDTFEDEIDQESFFKTEDRKEQKVDELPFEFDFTTDTGKNEVEEEENPVSNEEISESENKFSAMFEMPKEEDQEPSKEEQMLPKEEEQVSFTLDFFKKPVKETEEEAAVELQNPSAEGDEKRNEEEETVPKTELQAPVEIEKEEIEKEPFSLAILKEEQPVQERLEEKEVESPAEEKFTVMFEKPKSEEEQESLKAEEALPKEEEVSFTLDFLKQPEKELEENKSVEAPNLIVEKEVIQEEDFFSLNVQTDALPFEEKKEEMPNQEAVELEEKAPTAVQSSNSEEDDNDFFSLKALHIETEPEKVEQAGQESILGSPKKVLEESAQSEKVQRENENSISPEEQPFKDVLESTKPAKQSVDTKIPETGEKGSFSEKLKGLFGDRLKKSEVKQETRTASFKLKSDEVLEEPKIETSIEAVETPEAQKEIEEVVEKPQSAEVFSFDLSKKEDASDHKAEEESPKTKIVQVESDQVFEMIKDLGLDPEDEMDVIKDFINEAKINSDLVKEFIINKNFEKILYALIKVKSSAEILHIDSIVKITKMMQEACEKQNIEQIAQLNNKLSHKIQKLEKQLKVDAI